MVGCQCLLSCVWSIITLFIIFILVASSFYDPECLESFDCGRLQNLSNPFWRDGDSEACGYKGFNLSCQDRAHPIITINEQDFWVLSLNQSFNQMTIARVDLWDYICPRNFRNTTLNPALFSYAPDFYERYGNLSLFYDCSNQLSSSNTNKFPCPVNGKTRDAFYEFDWSLSQWSQDINKCSIRVDVPVPRMAPQQRPNLDVIRQGFNVSYQDCFSCVYKDGGLCGIDSTTLGFSCLAHQPGGGKLHKAKLVKRLTAGFLGIAIITCTGFICFKKMRASSRKHQDVEAFLRTHGPLVIERYNHSQLEKMTNSFKQKLGQGGYGTVYKGKLSDGRLVAVKMLNLSKGSEGEEFMNEVATISRTSHVNIVTLLGFCFEGKKKALVYEFMPNASLDRFICNRNKLMADDEHLGWEIMHKIAIGIARGLEYLHRGCNTRIVHFDIKPHNILLDENLCPKISDFGLAKLCTRKESIVSMLEARGTIGYIAPEVLSRNFGQVSYKSDVYSYGMMILEIVEGRKKDEINGAHGSTSSETMYFPHWLYKSVENGNESQHFGEISLEERVIVRKLTLVGLWCIQTIPSARPSMSKVIEMLEGSIEAIDIPPKFFASSPPRYPSGSSTTSLV